MIDSRHHHFVTPDLLRGDGGAMAADGRFRPLAFPQYGKRPATRIAQAGLFSA